MSSHRHRHRHLHVVVVVVLLLSLFVSSSHTFSPYEESQIRTFQSYLQLPTPHPNPNYTPSVSFLTSVAQSLNLTIQTLEFVPNKPLLLLTWPGLSPHLPSLLLNSHLDSVPAEPRLWSHPPFSAHRDPSTGRIFARGAQDDKSISIQYLESIRNLKLSNFRPLRSVHLSFVPDEEIGAADGMARFVPSEHFKNLNVGFVLDEGQASEGEDFRVFYADRSPWSLIVKATGQPGHGSRMFDGSAGENLMECVEAVARFREAQFDLVKAGIKEASEVVSVNLVYLKAGTPSPTGFVMNMQPSEAEAGFDVRFTPTEDPDLLRKRIEEEWAPISKNLTYQLIQKGPIRDKAGRPLVTATNDSNPWWSVFKQAIIASGGKLAKPEILRSTTDARFIRQMGIPTLGFSPMANTPILLHEHNEFLRDSVFLNGIKVYEHIISSLSSFSATAEQ
ncbi:putative aminoacylase-1 [Iris pallida]|uniref:N-acyl-aliphatic-L-amino acid amidohydrolase n=1 Tax=Iris pallida TaxID=29817 RepID=A0AAX6I0Y8_IRIPA|nr:putative aminoacylase-1 [Iris pallida]